MIPCYYWQVPVTEGGDQRVVPEERPALGEWADSIIGGGGPKTTHCIPLFLQLIRSLSQVSGCSFDEARFD